MNTKPVAQWTDETLDQFADLAKGMLQVRPMNQQELTERLLSLLYDAQKPIWRSVANAAACRALAESSAFIE